MTIWDNTWAHFRRWIHSFMCMQQGSPQWISHCSTVNTWFGKGYTLDALPDVTFPMYLGLWPEWGVHVGWVPAIHVNHDKNQTSERFNVSQGNKKHRFWNWGKFGGFDHRGCVLYQATFLVLNASQKGRMCKNRKCGAAYCLSHRILFILGSTHCVLLSYSPFKLEARQVCDWI